VANSFVTVHVPKWREHNPRTDVKKPHWYRVQYSLVDDPEFYGFTHEEFKAWHYIMSMCCRKNTDTVTLNYDHAQAASRISRKGLDGAISKLSVLKVVSVLDTDTSRERDGDVTDTNATVQDITGQNRTGHDTAAGSNPLGGYLEPAGRVRFEGIAKSRGITPEIQNAWLATYPDPAWVARETLKAIAYDTALPPAKKKKDYPRFIGNWLSRGWDRHTVMPSASPIKPVPQKDPDADAFVAEMDRIAKNIARGVR
jgi:hypothetical protein